jgi:hypothetical protein
MAQTRVTFGEWLPDQPGLVGALTKAENVYPKAVGYGPFPNGVDYSGAASENLNNVVAAKDSTGATKIFAGGATKLFLLDATDLSLDDVSAITTGYTSSERWRFTQFGSSLIAANGADTLQYWDLSTTSTTFVDLDAGAPSSKFVTVVRDFVVSGWESGNTNRVQWSGINDPTTWSSSAVTQSDFQDIPDGGEVRGITGGEFGLVLMERSIVRMSYVGTPLVFQFDNISRNLGCYEANSVIQWQGITYFLSDDGFYACDGQNIVPIGAEKVNRFFFGDASEASLTSMSAAVDPERNLVMWSYPTQAETTKILVYHIVTKRWSVINTTVDRIASSSTPAIALEGLDTFSASIDALDTSLDSRVWLGGKLNLAGVRDTKIITFSGSFKTGTIETADLQTDGQNTMITMAKPLIDGGSGSVAVASRLVLSETPTFGTQTAASAENRVGIRSYGKYHRLQISPSGDNWSTAIGVDIEIQPAGGR